MRALLPASLLLAAVLTTACGPTCQSTCTRFYAETECNAPPRGISADEAIPSCITICQDALQIAGPEPSPTDRRFDPTLTAPLNESPTLENEREAAAWMDCVWTFTDDECALLDQQYCAKIF